MPPSTTRPAQNISMADLTKELAKGPAAAAPKNDAPPPAEDAPPPEQSQRSTVPTPEPGKPIMQGLMDNVKKSMDEKAAAKPADAPPEKPAKKEVVSADDAPPPERKDPAAPPKPLTEAELGVQPHDSSRTRERITFLNAEKNRIAAEKAAIAKELEDLKKAPKTEANAEEVAKLREEHQKLQDEATRLRRRYDWDNDAEAKTKYREPIVAAEKDIEDAFKRNKFGDPTINAIKEAGGFAAFSRSQAEYPIEIDDPDNPTQKKIVNYRASDLARAWTARMSYADQQLVAQSVGKQELLKNDEKAAIVKAQEDAKGYYEGKANEQNRARAEYEAKNNKDIQEYQAWLNSEEASPEWMKEQSVPDGANPDVIKGIEQSNKFRAELREKLAMNPTNALEYGQLKLDAARSRHLDRTVAEKDAEIERLTAELKRKSAAQKTTGKGGSLLVKDGHKPDADKPKPGDTNFMSAIHQSMKQKAGAADDE